MMEQIVIFESSNIQPAKYLSWTVFFFKSFHVGGVSGETVTLHGCLVA
jgi:hypothetical protein